MIRAIPALISATCRGSLPPSPWRPSRIRWLVFERLFGAGSRTERGENLKRRQAQQHSLLDFVMEDASDLQRKLDGRDRQKLDQHLTSVREIEQRIEKAERMPVANPAVDEPAGIPTKFDEQIQLMADMMVLAFQTDSTRVATLLFALRRQQPHLQRDRSFRGTPRSHASSQRYGDD